MTGAAALNLIMARLAGRTNPALRANVLLELNLAKEVLEKGDLLPWFLIVDSAAMSLTADNRRIATPDDFLRELEDNYMEIQDSDGDWLNCEKYDLNYLKAQYAAEDTSELPRAYALQGEYFNFYPIPEVASPIRFNYYAADDAIADDTVETTWLKNAPDLIIGEAGFIVASLHVREDVQVVSFFDNMRKDAKARLIKENTARAEANTDRFMGDPE